MRQRVIHCKREDSVKLCIQDGDSELWLTAFTNEIEQLLKNTTENIKSQVDDIEAALMGLNGYQIKIQQQKKHY